jgi:DNA (cytosine-5)-methyltransferase 1
MRHGSLFSGIGGFDLASEWMGWENVFHCEWNEFGQKVLNYYWPKAISYHDITKTDFSIHRGTIDIITGGFPCQPYSMAGKRKGKEDERHLWPSMLRAIREIQPTWVVGENVLGLVNWDGGLVFHEVQADLEAEGYEVQPYVLPAASVNAPHLRQRVFFVAYSKSCADSRNTREVSRKAEEENGGWTEPSTTSEQQVQLPTESSSLFGAVKNSNKDGWRGDEWKKESNIREQRNSCSGDNEWVSTDYAKVRNATESKLKGLQGCTDYGEVRGKEREMGGKGNQSSTELTSSNCQSTTTHSSSIRQECREEGECSESRTQPNDEFVERCNELPRTDFKMFPSVSPICTRDDGLSDRLDSITFSKWRNESIKAGGNAIVPQVVHQIFKAIEQYESTRQT